MKLRKYIPQDAEQVIQLFRDTVHSINAVDYDSVQRQAWAPDNDPERYDKFAKRLQDNICYVADLEGKIIGFGDMSHDGYLDRLFTHKDHQRQGVAALIYLQLEHDARNLGLKEIRTEASITAKGAAERGGFEVREVQDKVFGGAVFRNYVMVKKLI